MAAAFLGYCACPLCSGQARVTLSKNDFPVLWCAHCGIQLFARSDRSDELIRDRIKPQAEPAAEPAAQPAAAPAESANAQGEASRYEVHRAIAEESAQAAIPAPRAAPVGKPGGFLLGW